MPKDTARRAKHQALLNALRGPLLRPSTSQSSELSSERGGRVHDGVGWSSLSQVTATATANQQQLVGHTRNAPRSALLDDLCYQASIVQLAYVLKAFFVQDQQCACRVGNNSKIVDACPNDILDGLCAPNGLFYCSICEDNYYRLLLERDVRKECNDLIDCLRGNDYRFHLIVLEWICDLICILPITIPIFMEGRVIDALHRLKTEVLSWPREEGFVKDHYMARLDESRLTLSTASAFQHTMEGLDHTDREERHIHILGRAVSLRNKTLDRVTGCLAAFHIVSLLRRASASDDVRNGWFNSLSTVFVNKWWEYTFDPSGFTYRSQGHFRLLQLLYNWYSSGRFEPSHETLALQIVLVPLTKGISISRDMTLLDSLLKIIVQGWKSRGISEFLAVDAGVRESLCHYWPSITRDPRLSSSNNEDLNWALKIIMRALVSQKGFSAAFGGQRDNITRYIDRLDLVTENSATGITAQSRANVLLSDTPFYYLISPPLRLERDGAVKEVKISWKYSEGLYGVHGFRESQGIVPSSAKSPVLRLYLVIIREDGNIKYLMEHLYAKPFTNGAPRVKTCSKYLVRHLKASDRVGVWVGTDPFIQNESNDRVDLRDPNLKLKMENMSIQIRYAD